MSTKLSSCQVTNQATASTLNPVQSRFGIIADAKKRMDEARRIEQEAYQRSKMKIPKKIFLVGKEKLSEEKRTKIKMLKRFSYGLRDVEIYQRKMFWGLDPPVPLSTKFDIELSLG